MLPLEDSRLLKSARSSVAAHSPLQAKPPITPNVHSSSPPPKPSVTITKEDDARETRRFQNQIAAAPRPSPPPRIAPPNFTRPTAPGVRRAAPSAPGTRPKPAIATAGTFSAANRPRTSTPSVTITKEDDARETRRFQNQVSATPKPLPPSRVAPPKPSVTITKEDDARETRRFQNQVSATPKPSSPPRVAPPNFIGPIAPGTRRAAPSNPAPNAAEHAVAGAAIGSTFGSTKAGTRTSVPSPLNQAKDAFKVVKENERTVGRAALESQLKSSGWVRVDGRWANDKTVEAYEKGVRSTIWTNPSREESIRITPDPTKGKGSSLRAYDGPSGGAVNSLMKDPGNNGWQSQGREGRRPQSLAHENPLDIHGNRGPDPGHPFKNTAQETHAELRPESNNGIVRALQNNRVVGALQNTPVAQSIENSRISQSVERGLAKGPLRIAGRAALPLAAAVDAYDLTKTYQQDGFGPKFRSEAAGVAGGWGTAFAAGAAGTAICGPLCGIAAGAGGYFVGSGAASKLEEGAEELGKGAVEEGKKLWHKVFG